MSNVSSASQELDFWEFVNCSRCHLPFITESGTPPVPFWLTECGHVICNYHLNSDQSCSQCGAQGIQLVPLQKEMEAPMSDWFRSVTLAFDSVAYAARFQMETLASLVRHYKKKSTQYRSLLDRVKDEYKTLKKTVEDLRLENEQLRQYVDYDQGDPSEIPNANRKRQMLDRHRHPNGARTNSSPRTVVTPLGPNRLTLPPDHQQPTFISHETSHSDGISQGQAFQEHEQVDRPGSSRFAQQYAYMPPQTPQSQAVPTRALSHAQAPPARQAVARQAQTHGTTSGQTHTAMMPPLAPPDRNARSHFQPAKPGPSSSRAQMPPPPTPQLQRNSLQQRGSFRPPMTPQLPGATLDNSRRFVPSTPSRTGTNARNATSNRSMVQQQGPQSQRFSSFGQSAGSHSFAGLRSGPGSAAAAAVQPQGSTSGFQSRSASMVNSGGQRMPFIPGP